MKKQITLFVLLLTFSSGVLFAQTTSYTDSVLSKKNKNGINRNLSQSSF